MRDLSIHDSNDSRVLRQLRHRLIGRINPRYPVVEEEIGIGDLRLRFVRVAEPDRVLDEVVDAEDRARTSGVELGPDEIHMPYWAELWDSAFGLAQRLVRTGLADAGPRTAAGTVPNPPAPSSILHPPSSSPRGPSVLDLGCGMGFAGTVAAAVGGRVLFADLERPALLFARLNSLPYRGRVRTRRLNWQTDRLDERFDLILGADILYERAQWEFLKAFWRHHLAPGGAVLLGEPGRQTGEKFPGWARAAGWRVEQFEEPVTTRSKAINLFRLSLP